MPDRIEVKYCRHCGHVIPVDTARCPYCHKMTIRGEKQKECPFCGELIKAKAIKCKHCGEFLDGRSEDRRQQVLHIENAVIATSKGKEGAELFRPDGRPISREEIEQNQTPKALPSAHEDSTGTEQGEGAIIRVREEEAVPAREQERISRTQIGTEPPEETELEEAEAPSVEVECWHCGRTVFADDNFCENCGQDLRVEPTERPAKRRPIDYPLADYALMVSAAGPVGLLLPMPFSIAISVVGLLLGGWCARTLFVSEERLEGKKATGWAIFLGFFWLILILLAKSW
ncbi:MAG: zinc ribbon domain-containing protein [Candidatus Brocadiia bacterium]